MKCVMYLRISTDKQTVEPQRLELDRYIADHGHTLVGEYSDVVSGGRTSRLNLDRMMKAMRAGEFEAIVVVKLDRLARSLTHFCQLLLEFETHRVALIVPGQGIDTSSSNPAGKFQMQVLGAVAEFERSIISERTKAGLAVVRARGQQLGKPSKTLLPNWKEILNAWRRSGGSYGKLAADLGGVSKSTAWRLDRNQLRRH